MGVFCVVRRCESLTETTKQTKHKQNHFLFLTFLFFALCTVLDWLTYLFGFGFFVSGIIVRFVRLYVIVVQEKMTKPVWLYVLCLLFPIFVLAIVALFTDSDRPCLYKIGTAPDIQEMVGCKLSFTWAIVTVIMYIFYVVISVVSSSPTKWFSALAFF